MRKTLFFVSLLFTALTYAERKTACINPHIPVAMSLMELIRADSKCTYVPVDLKDSCDRCVRAGNNYYYDSLYGLFK